jgi:hypothetical protein
MEMTFTWLSGVDDAARLDLPRMRGAREGSPLDALKDTVDTP